MSRTRFTWRKMWSDLLHDVHPPLYYIGLKLFRTFFGMGIWQARFFSWIPCAGMIGIAFFVRKEFGIKCAVWYLLFLFGNPFMFQKSVEIRMYTWTCFWVLLNAVFFYQLIRESRWKYWSGFCISGLAAAFNHYFGLLLMVCTFLGLLCFFIFSHKWKEIRNWFLMSAVTVVCYFPWLLVALSQIRTVNESYWIEKPQSRLGVLRELFYSVLPGSEKIFLLFLLFIPMGYLFLLFLRKDKARTWWGLVLSSAVWISWLFALLYMKLTDRPIMVSRYLIPGVLLFILGSCTLIKMVPRWVVTVCCMFFAIIGGLALEDGLKDQQDHSTQDTVAFAESNICEEDMICYFEDGYGYLASCVDYFIPWAKAVALQEGDEIPESGNGNVWIFAADSMIDSEIQIALETMSYYGEYGFHTERFGIYSR